MDQLDKRRDKLLDKRLDKPTRHSKQLMMKLAVASACSLMTMQSRFPRYNREAVRKGFWQGAVTALNDCLQC